ncbi:MAG: penicillin-binding protein [Oscillospiraceae bacterium]|nr:penicillin-binding protein [Oscillospiraceae bacterium]
MHRGRTAILWLLFIACAAAAVVLNLKMRNQDVDYEEVSVMVLSARDVTLKNNRTGTRTTLHEVEVLYDGERMQLENAHNSYSYKEGQSTRAYLAGGRLFANVEGIQTTTTLAKVYFGFLFGSFGLLFAACISMSKNAQAKRRLRQQAQQGTE